MSSLVAEPGVATLFSPLVLRGLRVPNRVVVSPMCTYSARDGIANDWHFAHLSKFALGGFGMIVVEATAVLAEGRLSQGDLGLWNDAQVAPLRRLVDFMKGCGVVPAIQLGHAGRKGSSQRPWVGNGPLAASDREYGDEPWETVSSGSIPVNDTWPLPMPLSKSEMDDVCQAFCEAARRAHSAGFEMIEIHMAHGYLLHQFLSPVSNNRDDEYGGSLENRMRYPLEVVRAVRAAWPSESPLFVRISAVDQDWSLSDSIVLAQHLRAAGVDVVDCSSGGIGRSPELLRVARGFGFQLPFAAAIGSGAGVRTMGVGLIIDPELAQGAITSGSTDLIAIGRGALVNPNWALDARRGLMQEQSPFDGWPKQYGVWLNQRERILQKIASDSGASQSPL